MFEVNGGGDILSTKAEFVCTEMCGTGVFVGIRAVWLHICAILAFSNPFNRAVVSVVLQHRSVVGDLVGSYAHVLCKFRFHDILLCRL